MLFSILNNAASGLRTTQKLIDTTSRNVTNAGTDGYRRKDQVSVVSPQGGAVTGPIQRSVNEVLAQQVKKSSAGTAYAETLSGALSNLDRLFGNPEAEVSLPSRMSQLGEAFQSLSADPTRPLSYQSVIDAADTLADTLRSTFQGVQNEETLQRTGLTADVDAANALIEKIAGINAKVPQIAAANGDTSDLLDERDQAVEQLSEYLEVTGFSDAQGAYHVYTKDNKLLASAAPHLLSIRSDGKLAVDDAPSDPANGVWNPGGSIGGRLELLSTTLPKYKNQLDDVAGRLAENFTERGIDLFNVGGTASFEPDLDPDAAPDTEAQFAGQIQVNDFYRDDPTLLRGPAGTPVGDLTLINRARDLMKPDTTVEFSGSAWVPRESSSLERAATLILGGVTQELQNAKADLDLHSSMRDKSKELLAEDTGVNLDDELSNLLMLQNAYAASARIMTVTQQMLDDLMRTVG